MAVRRAWVAAVVGACAVLAGCDRITPVTVNTAEKYGCHSNSISADGRYVAFSTPGDPSGLSQDQRTIIRRSDGTGSVTIAGYGTGAASGGSVTGDGGGVVFTRWTSNTDGTGDARAYLWRRSTGQTTPVSPAGESVVSPVISADGKWIAYAGDYAVWRVSVATGARTMVSPTPDDSTTYAQPTLSADGRYMTFLTRRMSENTNITWRDNVTGETRQLLNAFERAPSTSRAAISDDGRWVTFTKTNPGDLGGSPQVNYWDRTSGSHTRLTSASNPRFVGGATISGDGTRIAYSWTDRNTQVGRLVLVDRASRTSRTVVDVDQPIASAMFSKDGHTLSFCTMATDLNPNGSYAPNIYRWTDR